MTHVVSSKEYYILTTDTLISQMKFGNLLPAQQISPSSTKHLSYPKMSTRILPGTSEHVHGI